MRHVAPSRVVVFGPLKISRNFSHSCERLPSLRELCAIFYKIWDLAYFIVVDISNTIWSLVLLDQRDKSFNYDLVIYVYDLSPFVWTFSLRTFYVHFYVSSPIGSDPQG